MPFRWVASTLRKTGSPVVSNEVKTGPFRRTTPLKSAAAPLERLFRALGKPALVGRSKDVADLFIGSDPEHAASSLLNLGLRFEPSGLAVTMLVDCGVGRSSEEAYVSGLDLSRALTHRLGADPWTLREVQHLFSPAPSIPTAFAFRYLVSIRTNGDVVVSAMLNPNVMGREGASQLIGRACQLLGASPGVTGLSERRAEYFAVELAPPPIARIEMGCVEDWFLHRRADQPFRGATAFSAGQVADWLAVLAASGARGRVSVRSRLAASRGDDSGTACLLLPLGRYARSDAIALERMAGFLDADDAARLETCVRAFSSRPLHSSSGTFEWVGFSASDPARSLVQVDFDLNPRPSVQIAASHRD